MAWGDGILSGIGSLLGLNQDDDRMFTRCGDPIDGCAAAKACGDENPCEAAWQATYMYYADKQFDMAKIQALLGLLYGYIQYKSADRTADRQYDIANRQMSIAEEEYARYKCVYVECEDRYFNELCAIEYPTVDYDLYADRLERDTRRKFTTARTMLNRTRSRYCVSDHLKNLTKMAHAEALAVVAARDTGYRYAETRHDVLVERRHSRRMNVAEHGRAIKTDQSGTYSTGMGFATTALGNKLQARNSLYNTVFGVAQGMVSSYYSTQVSPFPYGSGYTGQGAATGSTYTGSGTGVSGGLHSGVGNL